MNVAERRDGENRDEDGYGKGRHEHWDITLSLGEGDLQRRTRPLEVLS
jgi:hypothetical protein